MPLATLIFALYFFCAAVVAFATQSPLIFVVALLMFPNIMQAIPFGLDFDPPEKDDENGKPIGFTADID